MKRYVKKGMLLVLSCLVVLLVFTGCGDSAAGSGTGEQAKEITYWSFMNEGEPVQQWMQTFIDDYEKETGVKVNVVWCGREVLAKLQSAIASGSSEDLPDIVDQMNTTLLNLQQTDGLFCELDDLMKQAPAWEGEGSFYDQFDTTALNAGRGEDGKLYCIPREMYTAAVFYNVKMFEENNVEVPQTWDEFLDVCETFKELGIAPIAYDGVFEEYVAWWFTRSCERLVGIDTLEAACRGEVKWADKPEFLQAAQQMQYLVDNAYFQENYEGANWPSSQIYWVSGGAAMYHCGTWLPAELSESTPEGFEMNIFSFPSYEKEASPKIEEVWGNYWAVLKDGNVEQAIDFINFSFQKKYDDAKSELIIPSPLKDGKPAAGLEMQGEILAQAESTCEIYGNLMQYGDYYSNIYCKNVNELMLGNMTAEEFIEKMDTDTQNYY
ncbi:ABC transporter substrate-binding protein [uncultured Ruthenibacterium sp.]|uniref:ABC transporter substrate-binding protein n=1 Tax=uncultured Ruthenibacterium sp. TaxID=1905347 RepID=UPI00349EA045